MFVFYWIKELIPFTALSTPLVDSSCDVACFVFKCIICVF